MWQAAVYHFLCSWEYNYTHHIIPSPWPQPSIYREIGVCVCWKKCNSLSVTGSYEQKTSSRLLAHIYKSYRDTWGYHFRSQNFILKPILSTQGLRFKNQKQNKNTKGYSCVCAATSSCRREIPPNARPRMSLHYRQSAGLFCCWQT